MTPQNKPIIGSLGRYPGGDEDLGARKTMRDSHLEPALSPRGLMTLPLAMAPSLITSLIGSVLTAPALLSWYPTLKKPFFTPPNLVFPIAWTLLFALMAVAFWRILRAKSPLNERKGAIVLFLGQMVLNMGWSYAFFTRQSPALGLVVVGLLLVGIALTIRAFLRIDRAAGYALYPYFAWGCFAALLNGAILALNPS